MLKMFIASISRVYEYGNKIVFFFPSSGTCSCRIYSPGQIKISFPSASKECKKCTLCPLHYTIHLQLIWNFSSMFSELYIP